MNILTIIVSVLFIFTILQDGFETVVLPRRVTRRFRLSRLFYMTTWVLWSSVARKMRPGNRRDLYLSYFGPLSLLLLLVFWAAVLVLAFALLQWGLTSAVQAPEKHATFGTYLYMSGTTFVTLGFGDVIPLFWLGRLLAVAEAGIGFLFLALIIGYVPIIYQAFSRREVEISLLDARAGSPPSATELLRRHYRNQQVEELVRYLCEWERWCAELLESHLSYPVLTYYRSQHERQSWLAALTTILDTSSLFIVGFEGITAPTVRFTFAIARHAAVDLAQVYGVPPLNPKRNRLSPADFEQMRAALSEVGLQLRLGADAEQRLREIRRMYEPFINALADHLLLNLPPWIIASRTVDDWQTSAWDHLGAWSPEKLDEITHIIIDHRKKMPLARGHEHPHTHEHQGEQLSSDGNGRATSS
ncbi:MAG: two pore domain potassium channel family protein [Chloroflexota bacterium]|nr:MAG: two pore domain potassium channel family protein [Chloroflexota bacterium]